MSGQWWSWRDASIFIALFLGIRILLIWMATKLFIAMMPDGDRCPMCAGYSLPIERDGWWRILGPNYRRSWCLDCGWEGVLRRSDVVIPPVPRETEVTTRH